MVMFIGQFTEVHADACCDVKTPAPIHLFAYRTHAHALGKVITGYKISKEVNTYYFLFIFYYEDS